MTVTDRIFNNTEYTLLRGSEVRQYFEEPWFQEEAIPLEVTGNGKSEVAYLVPTWRLSSVEGLVQELNRLEND